MDLREEFDALIHEFLTGDQESLKTIGLELTAIDKAFVAGEIDESMKDELLTDVAELVQVETSAELLETKIKVEKALDLLTKLVEVIL